MATGVTNQGFVEVMEQPNRFIKVFLELFEFFNLSEFFDPPEFFDSSEFFNPPVFFVGCHIDGKAGWLYR